MLDKILKYPRTRHIEGSRCQPGDEDLDSIPFRKIANRFVIEKNYPDLQVVSLDKLRDELDISPADDQGLVVQTAKEMAKKMLRENKPFVWNATNLTKLMRRQLISLFTAYGARVKVVYLEAPYQEILKRNRERSRSVPEKVIDRMITKLEVPDITEAHEVQWIVK